MDELIIRKGKRIDLDEGDLPASLSAGDVVIKGGNALDPWGNVGVLMASRTAGTAGRYYSLALARGVDVVIPISLQKAVHTPINDIAREMGSDRIDLCMGLPSGMHPLVGRVVTEVGALEMLFPVQATQIASGGTGKGAGSVSLLITGQETAVRAAFSMVQSLAGEQDVSLQGEA
jgi:hypothetical protein